ncbi:energy-coupled thiamine transporter ThiT [Mycoplasmatota bacterium]|nr:energy-coupled thiamine transporter ThiT [Mycoplasmatota bacterium]
MNKNRTVLIITEISILAAFALVLDYLANFTSLPNGGSLSIAMVPIMVISFRRGVIPGLATGLIVGVIQVIWSGHAFQFFQFILDYPVPYMLVGLASIFTYLNKRKINYVSLIVGALFAGFARYCSHVLAGVVFWGAYASDHIEIGGKTIFGLNVFTYSLLYNGIYMVPTIIVTVVVLVVLYKYAKNIFVSEDNTESTLEV